MRDFRCFHRFAAEFGAGTNFIVGPNARGKTSLLEAACVLLRLQSPRVTKLGAIIQHERRGFVVDGYFGGRHLQFYFSRERKKLALDGVEQKSATEYLQTGRLVYFANSDINLLRGGGEIRRRFLDFVAGQRENGYRAALRNYERALRSRNLLLKSWPRRWREIEAFNEPLVAAGEHLMRTRRALVADIQEFVGQAQIAISGARETVRMVYLASTLEAPLAGALATARDEDARLRQTTVGPHRDELQLFIDEKSSDFASEGQQRTLALALRLGAARLIERDTGRAPLLLLDDIFGELDLSRRNALLAALPEHAQKLITATHLDWAPTIEEGRLLRLE